MFIKIQCYPNSEEVFVNPTAVAMIKAHPKSTSMLAEIHLVGRPASDAIVTSWNAASLTQQTTETIKLRMQSR